MKLHKHKRQIFLICICNFHRLSSSVYKDSTCYCLDSGELTLSKSQKIDRNEAIASAEVEQTVYVGIG